MITTIGEVEKCFVFVRIDGQYDVIVEGFNEGFAEISVPVNILREQNKVIIYTMYKEDFFSFIAGSFSKKSNFKEKLFRAYGCGKDAEFLGFKLKIREKYCLITSENSSIFKIQEAISTLISEYGKTVRDKVNAEIDNINNNIEELSSILDNIEDLVFTNRRDRQEYEKSYENNLDKRSAFAENFIAYVQYFVIKNGQSVEKSVERAYEVFGKVGEDVAGHINEIQFLCNYCLYGDEIIKNCINIQARKFSESLGDF